MTGDSLNVSRETTERLTAFAALVEKWTTKINLISPTTIPHIWDRHIYDSAQIYQLAPACKNWVDLGSGGGFPGIVIAILAESEPVPTHMTLVESDHRKATFLRTAIRELSLEATVVPKRILDIPSLQADVLSARALAPLPALIHFADHHLAQDGTALFPKGKDWQKELADATAQWSFSHQAHTSKTNPSAAVLMIKDIAHV